MLGEDVVSMLMRGYSIKVAAAELGIKRHVADLALKILRRQEGCQTTTQLVCKLKRRVRERDRESRADYMRQWRLRKASRHA